MMQVQMFTREREAQGYIDAVEAAPTRAALRFMLNAAVSALATDVGYQEDVASGARLDLLTFIKAVHASIRLGPAVRDILDGKIDSIENTEYSW